MVYQVHSIFTNGIIIFLFCWSFLKHFVFRAELIVLLSFKRLLFSVIPCRKISTSCRFAKLDCQKYGFCSASASKIPLVFVLKCVVSSFERGLSKDNWNGMTTDNNSPVMAASAAAVVGMSICMHYVAVYYWHLKSIIKSINWLFRLQLIHYIGWNSRKLNNILRLLLMIFKTLCTNSSVMVLLRPNGWTIGDFNSTSRDFAFFLVGWVLLSTLLATRFFWSMAAARKGNKWRQT